MKIHNSAQCPVCQSSLGRPQEVVTQNGSEYTIYLCTSCDGEWYRSHE